MRVGSTSICSKPAAASFAAIVVFFQAHRRCTPPRASTLWRISGSISPRVTTSDTAKRPPGLQHAESFAQDSVFVGGKIDDAVGNDDIDRVVGQRDTLNLALQKLDVRDPRLALVVVGQSQHFVGHVETVGFAGGADAARQKAERQCHRRNRDQAQSRRNSTGPAPWDYRTRARPAELLPGFAQLAKRRRGWW